MQKFLLILVLTALAACSSTGPKPDEFTTIAKEWQGGNVQEMIEVWGDPRVLEQVGADDSDGFARWVHYFGSAAQRTRCEVTAYFGASGFISDVEVISHNCTSRSLRSKAMKDLQRP